MMSHHLKSRGLLIALLALALAGCSGNDTSNLLGSGAPTAQEATGIPAPAPTAAYGARGVAAELVSQTTTPLPDAVRAQLDTEEQLVANIYERAAPAVVRITTGEGLGSGFLIDGKGYIVTNNHVVAGSQGQVRVAFSGLFETLGTVVGTDPDSDIGVVKVDQLPDGVTPIELGDSNGVRVGQRTVAIGNPLEQDRTVTTGIVSALGRTIDESQRQQTGARYSIGGAIQTDAAINPGNSGGPLLNSRGQVIGMNTAILSESGTSSGIGFAVPVNLIKKVAPALIASGRYDHPYLGVSLANVTTLEAQQNRLPSAGVLIDASKIADSPVREAGLRGQAIVTGINNVQITSDADIIAYLEINTRPGDTITLHMVTVQGQQRDLQVRLGARPSVEDRAQTP